MRRTKRIGATVALGLALLGGTAAPALAAPTYVVGCDYEYGSYTEVEAGSRREAARLAIDCRKEGGTAYVHQL